MSRKRKLHKYNPFRLSLNYQTPTDGKQLPFLKKRYIKACVKHILYYLADAITIPQEYIVRIYFKSPEEIAEINHTYREKNSPTNILTFIYTNTPKKLETELLICRHILETEAKLHHKSFKGHFHHILIHGIMHSLGWDHEHEDDAEEMESLEKEILASFGIYL